MRFLLKNKWFILACILSVICGYGYLFTHGTCGIDDISIDLYFEDGLGVAIGRWPYYIINKIISVVPYTAFWGDFVTVIGMLAAAIVWCLLFKKIVSRELSIWPFIVFVFVFMDYSIHAEIYVFYLQNGLGWLHLLTALSLYIFYYIYNNHVDVKMQIVVRLAIIMMVTIAISFYEAAASVFLTGALLIILLDIYVKKQDSCFWRMKFIKAMFWIGRYLVYAMVARKMIRTIIMQIDEVSPYLFYRSVSGVDWILNGGIGSIAYNLKVFLYQLYKSYIEAALSYYPMTLFALASLAFLVLLFVYTIRNKDVLSLIVGIGSYASLYVLCLIEGTASAYRACQGFVIFVAFVFFVVVLMLEEQKKNVKILGYVAICGIICYSIYDMNQWFVLDYDKTEYEMSVIDNIAEELNSGKYDLKKPLVVVGDYELPNELLERYGYGQNKNSIIDWSVGAFSLVYGYNYPIKQIFENKGYEFHWAESDVIEQVTTKYYPMNWDYLIYQENYNGVPEYPSDGYIEESGDYIVIRL